MTRLQRLKYMREYTKQWKYAKGSQSSDVQVSITMVFNGSDPRTCSVFGCGRQLTLMEAMAGTTCQREHNNIKPDPTRVVKFR